MRSLQLPLRVAAGLAATAFEQARELPARIAGLPVTVASQALQLSMRVQQHITELAIKGDEVLSGFRPVEQTPEWATFDEDLDDKRYDASQPAPFDRVATDYSEQSPNGYDLDDQTDPWALEERALAEEPAHHRERLTEPAEPAAIELDRTGLESTGLDSTGLDSVEPDGPAELSGIGLDSLEAGSTDPNSSGIDNYDELSLPQLRARLRRFSVVELEALLSYERAHANRPAFVGMLTRRIATVRDHR
ncbi:MAG: lipid droplet-associated protein [Labedaea sp.]